MQYQLGTDALLIQVNCIIIMECLYGDMILVILACRLNISKTNWMECSCMEIWAKYKIYMKIVTYYGIHNNKVV